MAGGQAGAIGQVAGQLRHLPGLGGHVPTHDLLQLLGGDSRSGHLKSRVEGRKIHLKPATRSYEMRLVR